MGLMQDLWSKIFLSKIFTYVIKDESDHFAEIFAQILQIFLSRRSDPNPTWPKSSRSDRIRIHNTAASYLVRIFPKNKQVTGSIRILDSSFMGPENWNMWRQENMRRLGNLGVGAYISGLVLSPGQRTAAATCAVGTLTEQSTSPFTTEKSSDVRVP